MQIAEIAQEEQSKEGVDAASDFMEYLVENLTGTIIYSALKYADSIAEATPLEKAKITARHLAEAKNLLTEAVSEGFTQAWLEFSGRITEHVVEIKLVDGGDEPTGRPS